MVTTRGCSPSLEENKRVIIYFFVLVIGLKPMDLLRREILPVQPCCCSRLHSRHVKRLTDQAPERQLGSNSITMARRLCNIRMENAHLWLQAGAENESAMKNPVKKLSTKNCGACVIRKTRIYQFVCSWNPNTFLLYEVTTRFLIIINKKQLKHMGRYRWGLAMA